MVNAVIYSSLTGSCERYANLLSAALHVPAKPLGDYVRPDGRVVYIGWAFAGKIVGYKKAAAKYDVAAVVQVGMAGGGDNGAETARAQNSIPACIKVFNLQGGFYMDRLPILLRLIMKLKNKEIAAGLKKKASLDPRERALLTMATTGRGDPAAWDVSEIIDWCKAGE